MGSTTPSYLELMRWGPDGWSDELFFATFLTLAVALTSFVFGIMFGVLAARAKVAGSPIGRRVADAYTTVMRGVPDLLVIYLFYFGGNRLLAVVASWFGVTGFVGLPEFLTAALAIGLVSGAYQTEVIRGSYHAIPKGEIEAARACGMSGWTLLWRIVGPQVLRYAVPGMGNVWQLVLKESALVAVVGLSLHIAEIKIGDLLVFYEVRFSDLLRQAHVAAGSTRVPFPFYITCAALYLAMTTVSTLAFRRAESWATRGMRKA